MKVYFSLVGLLLLTCGCEGFQQGNVGRDSDNTAINERDADSNTVTPFDQSNEQADIDLVAEIRSQVLELKDLSINGRNVKIITDNGKVVLRGPVASATERQNIVAVATQIAGAGNVTDQLEVDLK